MLRRREFGGVAHDIEVYSVPCKNPEKHKETTKVVQWGEECWMCITCWHDKLPWIRSALDERHYADDESLLTYLRLSKEDKSKPRFSVTYNNVWNVTGKDGYVSELFGIEMGESEKIESYPYYRLSRKAKPIAVLN